MNNAMLKLKRFKIEFPHVRKIENLRVKVGSSNVNYFMSLVNLRLILVTQRLEVQGNYICE